jgi:hypothetical protein
MRESYISQSQARRNKVRSTGAYGNISRDLYIPVVFSINKSRNHRHLHHNPRYMQPNFGRLTVDRPLMKLSGGIPHWHILITSTLALLITSKNEIHGEPPKK